MWERLGSGGPRGLQILRSGVKSVRGGFDSHAFPPAGWSPQPPGGKRPQLAGCAVAGFALVLALLSGAPARAQGVGPAGSAPAAEGPAPPPRTGGTAARKPPSRFEAPRWVMMRSLVIPGWGQLHNGSWIKALAVAGVEGTLGYHVIQDLRELDRLEAEIEAARRANDAEAELVAITAYNDRQSTLVAREWLLGGAVLYAMVDAYVDAHFRNFDIEFRHDPALPEGAPDRKSRGASLETRLAIRWTF